MPRRWLKGRLPEPAQMRERLGIDEPGSTGKSWLRETFADPMLWHVNRRSMAGGVAVGLFVSWMPVPLQMLVAAFLSAVLRVHVPVSVVMVWFTNPLTIGPLLYAAWTAGSMITGTEARFMPISFSFQHLWASASTVWPVLLAGSFFCASVTAVIGFFSVHLIWRFMLMRRWRRRLARNPGSATEI